MHKTWKGYPLTTGFIFTFGFEMWVSVEVPLVASPSITAVEINTTAGLPHYVTYEDHSSGGAPFVSSL